MKSLETNEKMEVMEVNEEFMKKKELLRTIPKEREYLNLWRKSEYKLLRFSRKIYKNSLQ